MKLQIGRIKNGVMMLLFLAAYSLSAVVPFLNTQAAYADAPGPHKSYVCKYVGTPYVDERLQPSDQNPIWVDNHSLLGHDGTTYVGQEFSDQQGRSVVIVANTDKLDPEPGIGQCPAPHGPKQVPLPNPNYVDECGPRNSEWTVPADSKEIVWTLMPSGHLIAETTAGYEFTDGTTKHDFGKAPDSGEACPVDMQPPAPVVKKDKCGTAHDTFWIPSANGVTYYINGQEVAAGVHSTNGALQVTVTAVAEDGSGYTKNNSWTLTFTDVPCATPVTPQAPAYYDACELENDTFTIPTTPHVRYFVGEQEVAAGPHSTNGALSITITAKADQGYVISGQSEWTLHFTDEECGGGQGEGQPVKPLEPTVAVVCGPNNDTVTLPEVQHLKYSQTGWVNGKNVVTATAHEGYYIEGTEGEMTMEWIFTDANTPCGNVLGDTTTTPNVPVVASAELQDTGNSVVLPMLLSTGILSLALMTMLQKGGKRSSKLAAFVQRASDRLYAAFAQPFVLPTA